MRKDDGSQYRDPAKQEKKDLGWSRHVPGGEQAPWWEANANWWQAQEHNEHKGQTEEQAQRKVTWWGRVWRLLVGVACLTVAVVSLVAVIGTYVDQSHLIRWKATVTSRTCKLHQAGGEDSPYTTCTVNLSYPDPQDSTLTDTDALDGIDIPRIHDQNTGHEWMWIYFDSSYDLVNPQDNMPWWAALLIVIPISLPLAAGGSYAIWRAFRPRTKLKHGSR